MITGLEVTIAVDNNLTHTFLIDVVKGQIKQIHKGDTHWWKYKEIKCSGKIGEDFSVVWLDGRETRRRKVVKCEFIKVG